MARVVHFEVHAADPERAKRFYETVFGWRIQPIPAMDYWTIATGEGPGINGGMLRRRGDPPVQGQAVNAHMCAIGVDDIDASMDAAMKAGATLALPKMTIPNVGYVAYLVDTEGNIFGIHQADPNATM
ncbi:MAG: VOC family protein [Caulobacteraceae bacterium]